MRNNLLPSKKSVRFRKKMNELEVKETAQSQRFITMKNRKRKAQVD